MAMWGEERQGSGMVLGIIMGKVGFGIHHFILSVFHSLNCAIMIMCIIQRAKWMLSAAINALFMGTSPVLFSPCTSLCTNISVNSLQRNQNKLSSFVTGSCLGWAFRDLASLPQALLCVILNFLKVLNYSIKCIFPWFLRYVFVKKKIKLRQ